MPLHALASVLLPDRSIPTRWHVMMLEFPASLEHAIDPGPTHTDLMLMTW